jgi:hypothetical protein
MVDKFVDVAVSPSGIAAMAEGRPPTDGPDGSESKPRADPQKQANSQFVQDPWSMGYVNWSKFAVTFIDKDTGQDAVVLTLKPFARFY